MLRSLAALAALVALAGCGAQIEADVKMTDMVIVADNDSIPIPATGILRIPQQSEEACEDGLANLLAKLAALTSTGANAKCVEVDGNQMAEVSAPVMITTSVEDLTGNSLFLLIVGKDEVGYEVSFALTKPLSSIKEALAASPDEATVALEPTKITIRMQNDSDVDWEVVGYDIFLDGDPAVPEMGTVSIKRGRTVPIILSDVASAYVERANRYRFLRFEHQ
jgi:hypothetical protein